MARFLFALFILAGVFVAPFRASFGANQQAQILTGKAYFESLLDDISNAESSIEIALYFIIADPRREDDPVHILLDELIRAKARGVKIKARLEGSKWKVNQFAYLTLKQAGIDVHFDRPTKLLHAKCAIIDRMICYVGSANWSRAAMEDNLEVTVRVESKALARDLAGFFERIETEKARHLPFQLEGVKLPRKLLLSEAMRRMVKDRAQKAFDVYLLLLKYAQKLNAPTFKVNWYELAGVPYEKIRRPLRRLSDRYRLIKRTPRSHVVALVDPFDTSREWTPPTEDYFIVPNEYWRYDYSRRLSLRAKHAYLLSLLEASKSSRNPYWFRSQEDLAQIYGLSEYTISLGLLELEREDIIEVYRGVSEKDEYGKRRANTYLVKALISPEEFDAALSGLRRKYGKEIVHQAQGLSSKLNEPKDLLDIETYAGLIEEFGYEDVKRVNDKVAGFKKGSGLRSVSTAVSILRGGAGPRPRK